MANSFTSNYLAKRGKKLGAAEASAVQTRKTAASSQISGGTSQNDFTTRYLAKRQGAVTPASAWKGVPLQAAGQSGAAQAPQQAMNSGAPAEGGQEEEATKPSRAARMDRSEGEKPGTGWSRFESETEGSRASGAGEARQKTVRSGSFGGGTDTTREGGFTGRREMEATEPSRAARMDRSEGEKPGAEYGAVSSLRRREAARREQARRDRAGRQEQADWGKILKGAVLQGADQAAKGITSTAAMLEGAVLKPVTELLGSPDKELYKEGLFYKLNEVISEAAESNQERFQPEYEKGGKLGEAVGKYGAATVAAVPQAALAFMTAGQSLAAQGTTAGLQAASAAAQGAGIARTVTTALQGMAKNPQFLYSVASTMGSEYEQAKADGASDLEAYSYAALTGLLNAQVEIGGGIDVLPDSTRGALRQWVGTMLEEGKEEVVQGAVSQLAQNAVYGKGNALASLTDENAIISGKRAGEEFLGGAVVGGILGGGQIGVLNALSGLAGRRDSGTQPQAVNAPAREATEDVLTPESTAAPPTVQNAPEQAVAREYGQEEATEPSRAARMDRSEGEKPGTGWSRFEAETEGSRASGAGEARQNETAAQSAAGERGKYPNLQKVMNGGSGVDPDAAAAGDVDMGPRQERQVKEKGVTDYGEGSDLLSGGQAEWRHDTGAGEQGAAVPAGTGGGQSRNLQNVRAGDRADAVAWAYQQAGAQPVSTREYLGTQLGTDDIVLREAPESVIRGDSELQKVYDEIRETGYRPHLFTGRPMLEGGQEVSGMIRGGDVFIRVDHARWTPEQIWRHEQYHAMAGANGSMVMDSWQGLVQTADRAQLMQTLKTYREKYHGIYDIDESGNTVWNENVMLKIVEEILADAYAGKDSFRQSVSQYTDTVKDMVQQRSGEATQARGPPEGRFTFAGQDARTADAGDREKDRDFTAQKRRETALDPGDANTVFADGASVYHDPMIRDYHTEAQRQVIREYNEAVDMDLLDYVEGIIEQPEAYVPDYHMGEASPRAVDEVLRLTGVDTTGFDTIIKRADVEHILKRHGSRGQQDRSMRDPEDIARIRYVLDNYDIVEPGKGTRALRDRNGDPAQTVVFSKKINGTYYVVEAVADNKARATRVISAYMAKNGAAQVTDTNAPVRTSENGPASAPMLRIAQDAEKGKERFAIEDDRREASRELDAQLREIFPETGQRQVKEVADLVRGGAAEQQLRDAFNDLYDNTRVFRYSADGQELADIVKTLRGKRVYIDPDTKSEFGDDWKSIRQQAFGRGLYFTSNQQDAGLDALNEELASLHPGYFDAAQTDPTAIVERIMDTYERSRGEQISLDEEAMEYGGQWAVQEYRDAYRQRFMDAVESYQDKMRGLDEQQRRQREDARAAQRRQLDQYVEDAREILRRRAAQGMEVKNTRLPGPASDHKAYDVDEYLAGLQRKAEAARAQRLRNIPKAEFTGTEAVNRLGIKIEGSVTNYYDADQMRGRQQAAESIRRELRKAEKRLNATAEEKRFASDFAAGIYTEASIPPNMDADKIMELADYYMAERAQGVNMIRQRKADINALLDERMEVLFKDSDKYKPSKAIVLNNRTPQRNMLKIFGDEQGKVINEQIFDPVAINEAERIRFVNRQFDQVRTFRGRDGKESRLNKQERALTQMVIEGKAVEEIVAGMEMGEAVRRVGENIQNGQYSGDGSQEFGLSSYERDLARKYARWLDAQQALRDGKVDEVKVANAAGKYSELFDRYYEAINDFLVVHGYEPIGFIKGYAPHLQPEQNHNLLNKAFQSLGINTDVTTLPASIAGMTADYRPGKKWNPYFLQRTGDVTEYDIAAGFESYVNYLSDVLYHTDDIMRVRRAEKYFRKTYAPEEIRSNIEWAEGLRHAKAADKIDMLREAGELSSTSTISADDLSAKMEAYIDKLYEDIQNTSKYSEFAVYLNNYANILAGKQSMADRGWEYAMGRGIMNLGNKLTRAFSRAQVAGNLSSALNQTSQIPQILGENGMVNTLQAAADMMSGKLRRAGFAQESDVLTGKQGISYLVATPADMVTNALFTPAQMMDGVVSTLAVRGAYLRAVKSGMDHEAALKAADKYANSVMGNRTKGSRPLAFEAKNPVSQMAHIFQLEALNNWEHLSQDLPRDFREIEAGQGKAKAAQALAGVVVKTLLSAFLLNRIAEEAYGGTPAPFDLMGLSANFIASGEGLTTNQWLMTMMDNAWERLTGERFFDTERLDAERDFDLFSAVDDAAYNVMNDIPFLRNVAGLLGLGDQTLPWPDFAGKGADLKDAISEDGLISSRTGEAALNLAAQFIPGGRQISKSYSGIKSMVTGGQTYGYGDNARMQYPVERSPGNIARAVLFGVNATPESREYWANGGEDGLSAKQTRQYNSLVEAGADREEAFELMQDVKAAESTMDKIMEVAETPFDESIKELALENIMGEKQHERYMAARGAGILTLAYADFLEDVSRETKKRGGSSASQDDVQAALEQSGFTDRQKAAIWNSYGWKKESPWGEL